jgi:hypothetical protein
VKIVTGNLWDEVDRADVLLVTSNAVCNAKGALVMGRGAARECAVRYPDFPLRVGNLLRGAGFGPDKPYGVMYTERKDGKTRLGLFQVKHRWFEAASLDLIRLSTDQLLTLANGFPKWRIAMNFPGIGNGRLTFGDVLPIIGDLPNSVIVYQKGHLSRD